MKFSDLCPMSRRDHLLALVDSDPVHWHGLMSDTTKRRLDRIRASEMASIFWVWMVADQTPTMNEALDARAGAESALESKISSPMGKLKAKGGDGLGSPLGDSDWNATRRDLA